MRRTSLVVAAIVLIVLVYVLRKSTHGDDAARAPDRASDSNPPAPIAPRLPDPLRVASDDSGPLTREIVATPDSPHAKSSRQERRLVVHVIDPIHLVACVNAEVTLVELRSAEAWKTAAGPSPQLLEFGQRSRTTDESGDATFLEVPIGRFKVHCDGPSAFSDELTIETSQEPTQRIELKAWPSAELTGLVLDESGGPVDDASISAMPIRTIGRRTTSSYSGADGSFRIADIDVHEDGARGIATRIRASSPSWLDIAEIEFELRAGKNELAAPLVMHTRAASLFGRIVDALGVPVNGASVECRTLLSKSAGPFTATTDDRGRFVFRSLAPGRFAIACPSICLEESEPIEIALGAKVDVGDLKPPPTRFDVAGFAFFDDGRPAAGATVHLKNQPVVIAADGSFSFSRCDSAPVTLLFRWHETNEYVHWGQVKRDVVPGGPPLRVVLSPKGVVFRLVDAASHALIEDPEIEVGCLDRVGQASSYRFPKAGGEFRLDLDDLDPPVTLRFVARGYGAFEMKYEPPKDGYEDRHVVEVPLEKL